MAETNNIDLVNFREGKIGLGTMAPALSTAPLPPKPSLTWAGDTASDPLTIRNINGTVGLSLTADGNVGIGTPSPTGAKLVIEDTASSAVNINATTGTYGLSLGADANHPWIGSRTNHDLRIVTNSSEKLRVTADGKVGIGTGATAPLARLQVAGGAIMPAAGNSESAGILFPKNPGGGTGDAAWIRYYVRTGEETTLEIGTANDTSDHIAFMASGGVGIGTITPGAKLDINGGAFLGYETSLSDFGALLKSGFYQNTGAKVTGDVPDTAHSWTHLITARHSNTANNHQLQIAASYATNDKLYFRKIAAGGVSNPAWNEVATRGQNAFVGNQSIQGALSVTGTINAARSEVYFTDVGHNHTGAGNTTGHAAIENAADYGALMILGRAGTPQGRKVRLWDYLSVEGDMAILSKHAFRGSDSWLRLNQDGAFTSGVHTPGVFAPGSLNVGGVSGWGNPGSGNIWMAGQLNKLDVADNFTATIRAADLLLGYSGRRGSPGRALVDYKDSAGHKTLRINYDGDWTGGCRYYVSMDRASSRKFKDNVKALASESAHEILDGLEPVTFRLKSDSQPRSYLGFIAEDVPQEVGAADREAVNTDHIVAVLTRVVKDQQQDLQALRDRLLSLAGTTQYSHDR